MVLFYRVDYRAKLIFSKKYGRFNTWNHDKWNLASNPSAPTASAAASAKFLPKYYGGSTRSPSIIDATEADLD